MCGRYTIAIQAQEVADELRASLTAEIAPHFNVAPTQDAPIAVERHRDETDGSVERRIGLARFGLVPGDSEGPKAIGAKYINLRAEGVAAQKAFAKSAALRRCLVIADGFYEWKRDGKAKQAYFVRPAGGGLLTFAGIWDVWGPPESRTPSFAILTTKPDALMTQLHDRMPLIVPASQRDRWLSPEDEDARALIRELQKEPAALEAWRVSPRVGNVANDDASLREPIDADRLRSAK